MGVENNLQVNTYDIKLRAMQSEDQAELAQLYLTTRKNHFSWVDNPKLSDFDYATTGEHVQVAVIQNEIVGFASLSEWDSFLHLLFVKTNWQNNGVGKALLNWARTSSHLPLELKVVQANQAARRFYDREGFKVIAYGNYANPTNVTYRDDRKS